MKEKKNILPVLALIGAVLSLIVSVAGLFLPAASNGDAAAQLEDLRAQNALLQEQITHLTHRLNSLPTEEGLAGWSLSAAAWDTGTGADVTLTATPGNYQEGMNAAFIVRLNGQEIRSETCTWDGTAFSATVSLDAEDGYGYYCLITDADGSRQQIALSTPENPVEDIPVYLAASLRSYCNMTMDSWYDSDGKLTVSLAYVQAQLPRLTTDGDTPTIVSARLLLTCNGSDYSELPLTMEAGDAPGAYQLTIAGGQLDMPQLTEDDYLDLFLEVTLSDGQTLSCLGGSWYWGSEGLFLVVG